jgi:hypothetical protein
MRLCSDGDDPVIYPGELWRQTGRPKLMMSVGGPCPRTDSYLPLPLDGRRAAFVLACSTCKRSLEVGPGSALPGSRAHRIQAIPRECCASVYSGIWLRRGYSFIRSMYRHIYSIRRYEPLALILDRRGAALYTCIVLYPQWKKRLTQKYRILHGEPTMYIHLQQQILGGCGFLREATRVPARLCSVLRRHGLTVTAPRGHIAPPKKFEFVKSAQFDQRSYGFFCQKRRTLAMLF